jgi:hypothetical protein
VRTPISVALRIPIGCDCRVVELLINQYFMVHTWCVGNYFTAAARRKSPIDHSRTCSLQVPTPSISSIL